MATDMSVTVGALLGRAGISFGRSLQVLCMIVIARTELLFADTRRHLRRNDFG